MSRALIVHLPVPTRAMATKISKVLVQAKLAGCVQTLGPMQSTYRWKGKIKTATEYLLLVKTTSARYTALEKKIRSLHPYEAPEILAIAVVRGEKKYLKWLGESTR